MEFSLIISVLLLLWIMKTRGSSDGDLIALRKEYGMWRMEIHPAFATSKNFYEFNDRLEDYSPENFDNIKIKVDDYLAKLRSIPYNRLSEPLQIDHDMMTSALSDFSDGYAWRFYGAMNPVNYMEGPHSRIAKLAKTSPFNTIGDFENFLSRLRIYPKQVDGMIERMKLAISHNTTNNMVTMSRLVLDKALPNNVSPSETEFYTPFREQLDAVSTVSDDERAEIRRRGEAAIRNILSKYTEMKTFVKEKYMNNLRPGLGVSSLKNGASYYRECLKWHLSLDLTPEEVHQKGQQEVKRIKGEMQKAMTRLGFVGTIKEFFESLKGDPRFFRSNASEILAIYDDIIHKQIKPKISTIFKDLPGLPVVVRASPSDGAFGYYNVGSSDGTRPGVFYINLFRPSEMSTIDAMALALHEAVPGHHIQKSVAVTTDLPIYRKYLDSDKYFQVPTRFPFNTAYKEGWGLYAESLGEDMGLYTDDYSLMGRYSFEIFRACRLVVDTGIHYFNWTRSEAVTYLLQYTALGQGTIENEVDRYVTWPGQACAYKIGELKIQELRKLAKSQLGRKFDLKDFHSVVLRDGAMPLETLEKVVRRWIVKTQQSKSIQPCEISGVSRFSPAMFVYLFCLTYAGHITFV